VSEEIDLLWELHGLDEELQRVESALARFPEERAALARRVAGEEARLEALRTRVAELQKSRRGVEREVQALVEAEKRFQNQLLAVKKNEEYQALLHEIEGTRRRRSDLETEVLMALEGEDEAQRERPALERSLSDLRSDVAERLAVLETGEEEARQRAAGLEADRRRRMESLPAATRGRYERIRGSRGGRAVVPIAKGACGGCFRAQPPQVLQAARHRVRLLTCDGCGRLMVWPPEGGV
jgi:hypothetical protein